MEKLSDARARLRKLVDEEKVIKAALEQIKNKYLQLHVEHISLCVAKKDLVAGSINKDKHSSKAPAIDMNVESGNYQNTVSPVNLKLLDEELQCLNNPTYNIINNINDLLLSETENVSEYSELEIDVVDQCFENNMDNPLILNRVELNAKQLIRMCSEVESSDDDRL